MYLAQTCGFCCSARHMKQRHRNTKNHQAKIFWASGPSPPLSIAAETVFNQRQPIQLRKWRTMSTSLLFLNKIPNVHFTPQATPTMRNTTFWSNFFSSSGDSHVGSQNYTMDLNAGMIIYQPRTDVQSMQDGIWNLPLMRSLLSYSEVQRMYLFPLVGSWKILLAPHMHLTQTCAAVYLQLLRTGHTICTS